jgi:hypothetical protein
MLHAKSSAKKYGGKPEDYLAIHDFMDSSKQAIADVRHRIVFHSAFGAFVTEKMFGHTITNSDGREVSVRDVAEDHILEDLGFIPSLEKWLVNMPIENWMGGPTRKTRTIPFEQDPLSVVVDGGHPKSPHASIVYDGQFSKLGNQIVVD